MNRDNDNTIKSLVKLLIPLGVTEYKAKMVVKLYMQHGDSDDDSGESISPNLGDIHFTEESIEEIKEYYRLAIEEIYVADILPSSN